ncbi:TRAP transporter small permease subunit [Pseudemcibacter aquimaris]|uniref:TRAP transporter small permease subunit n=1 Tax=Pseudemcibacter aquimaris TaxID=2857064 RepID=UPI002012D702|nr:TRAP transporter small permease subunit [Pseudemcibacter aquimaris]MCC3860791.1 TRAP transporter small permease subunit [Pseudemcibacter aquimaris]WDU59611.1 TRAP transporter small permease subunit [Pseudemcibacter aquimaris]
MLIALMITIIFDVIGRRFMNTGSVALQELEWHFHGALFLLCLGFNYIQDAHVRVDLFRENFSYKTNRLIEICGCLLFLIPYSGVVIYFGIDFALKSYLAGEMSATSDGLSYRWIIKSFLPLGFLLLGLSGVSILLNRKEVSND